MRFLQSQQPLPYRLATEVLVAYLTVEDVHVTAEVLRDNSSAKLSRLLSHVRNLHQHGTREVTALQQIKIDVHMVRCLPSSLGFLLLRRLVLNDRVRFHGKFISSQDTQGFRHLASIVQHSQ